MENLENDNLVTRENILSEAVDRCYRELYLHAQPSADINEIRKYCAEHGDDDKHPVYSRYYISEEEYSTVMNKFIDAYGIHNEFNEHCEAIIRYFDNGLVTKRVKDDEDSPSYRGYENLPPLKELIGEEHYQIVLDRIKQAMDFYRFNREESAFRFTVGLGYAPTTNKQTVIDYWKSQGVNIDIKDRTEEEIFDRHYYGITEFDENGEPIDE